MTLRHAFSSLVPFMLFAAVALQGCVPAVLGGTTTVGVAAVQERSVGDAVDDAVTHTSVNEALFSKDVDLYSAVNVEVVEGRVLLTGSVRKPEDRVEAVRLAWQANGVREVIDEIQVTDKSGLVDIARDSWISTQLKSRLLFDKKIDAINYNVETVNGVVYMIGIAQNKAELERATNHARTIRHVRQVISHVRMKDERMS
ncbi:MAG: BON domain-containing protein [Alphaproteobacteria bacterium]